MINQLNKIFLNRTLAICFLVLVWIMGALSLQFFYQQQINDHQSTISAQIEQRVSMLSMMQAELINKEFSSVASSLIEIADLQMNSPELVDEVARKIMAIEPSIWHIHIADQEGAIRFTTREGYIPPLTELDYFSVHQNSEVPRIYISTLRQTLIQESSRYVAVSYPLHKEEKFNGVVVITLKSEDLTAQLGKITANNNITAVLTDAAGKVIWYTSLDQSQPKTNIYSLCKNRKFLTSTEFGIHRIKLTNNAHCDFQYLERWGMYSIIAENLSSSEQSIRMFQQQMIKRNLIILCVFILLLIIVGIQILKQIESRQRLAILNQRNKAIIDAMPDLLLTMKVDGTIIDLEVQDDFPLILPPDQLKKSNIKEILAPDLVEKKMLLMAEVIQTGESATIEYPMVVDEQECYFLERLTALDENHILAFIIDITSRREAERKLEWQAYHDDLTGLANRVMFFEFLSQLIMDYHRNQREFTILFIDLNGFKGINDQHGHHAGDEILKNTANQLKDILRKTDIVARLGGDEFAVLLPETSPTQAQRVIKTIIKAVKQPFIYNNETLFVTASIGMAACPYDSTSADELLSTADKRMYEVKSTR